MEMSTHRRLLFFENNAAYFLSHRLPLALAMRARGDEVHVAAIAGPAAEKIRAAGFEFHPVEFTRGGVNPAREWLAARRVRALYRELQPALAYQVTVKPVIYGTLAARRAKVPAVLNVVSGLGYFAAQSGLRGNILRNFGFAMYRHALRHPNQMVIFHNADDREEFVRRGVVADHEAVVLPGSGVDLDYFRVTKESADPPLVVLPARMLREKGVMEFIEAAQRLLREGVRARFLLAGKLDPQNPSAIAEAELRRRCAATGVQWNGPVTDMRALYAASHIVCLPSWHEGMPRVLLEAAACGRPAVATNVPGCRDAVTDGETGLLVSPRNAAELAAALRKLILDAALRQRLGARGRVIAEERFSAQQVVARTVEIMEGLMAARGHPE